MDRLTRTATAMALILLAPSLTSCHRAAAPAIPARAARAGDALPPREVGGFGALPLRFEPNVGQAPPEARFSARGQGYFLGITARGAILALGGGTAAAPAAARLHLHALHAGRPRLIAEQPLASLSNYFLGNQPARWHSNIANYAAVRYRQLYPGIDWVIHGSRQQLEYDFIVAPHADPGVIRLAIEGADSLSLDPQGGLLIRLHDQLIRQLKPVIYQATADGERRPVAGRYVLARGQVGFALGDYDRSRALIIDPTFVYSTYLGGALPAAIATDGEGNAYVAGSAGLAGSATAAGFPRQQPLQGSDLETHFGTAFITKFNANGSALVYSTYLGGSGGEQTGNLGYCGPAGSGNFGRGGLVAGNGGDGATAIAVDAAGNVYVAGFTGSSDFPTVAPLQAANRAAANHGSNAFVAKLNAAGNALLYSTYLGGSGTQAAPITGDSAAAIAVDATGSAYVAGITMSPDFPTQGPFQSHDLESALNVTGFVAKLNASGSALVYSSYLGGSGGKPGAQIGDCANAIAVDASGNAYVAGQTSSTDFPTVAALQPANHATGQNAAIAGATGFLTELNPGGSALTYSTYLGGSGIDAALAVAVDALGDAYVTGYTWSTDFPTANALQPQNATHGGATAFVSKFAPGGGALIYSTYLGGSTDEQANSIGLDAADDAFVAGSTYSSDFPLVNPLQAQNNAASHGANNAFIAVLDPSGSALDFSTYLGGSGVEGFSSCPAGDTCPPVYDGDSALAIAVDALGDIYVTGVSNSTDFPTVAAFDPTPSGMFVTRIDTGPLGTPLVVANPPPSTNGGGGALGWELIGLLAVAWTRALVGFLRMLAHLFEDAPEGGGAAPSREAQTTMHAHDDAACLRLGVVGLAAIAALTGCGGSSGSTPGSANSAAVAGPGSADSNPGGSASYTVSATVTGLTGQGLAIALNGGEDQAVSGDGTVTFAQPLASGVTYAVTVATQPSTAREICGVSNGSGTIGQTDVTGVAINCGIVAGFVYQTASASAGANQLLSYGISQTSGALVSFGTPLTTGAALGPMVSTPGGGYLIVGSASSGGEVGGSLTVFTVDSQSGALRQVSTLITSGFDPISMVLAPQGFLFVFGGTAAAGEPPGMPSGPPALLTYALDAGTGALTATGSTLSFSSSSTTRLAVRPDGAFLYVLTGDFSGNVPSPATLTAYAIDATTGALTAGPVLTWMTSWNDTTDPSGSALAIEPLGRFLYLASEQGDTNQAAATVLPYAIDAASGALTAVGTGTPVLSNAGFMTADPTGQYLYVLNNLNSDSANDTVLALAIDQGSGAVTPLGSPLETAGTPFTMICDPSGQFAYVGTDSTWNFGESASDIAGFVISTSPGSAGQLLPGSPGGAPGTTIALAIVE